MRPVLIRVLLDQPWALWAAQPDGLPGVGAAVVWIFAGLVFACYLLATRGRKWTGEDIGHALIWLVGIPVVAFGAPRLKWDSVPVFGYGLMVLTGFATGVIVGQRRARRVGIDPGAVFDAMFWTLLCGVVGGRLFFLVQHGDDAFRGVQGVGNLLKAAINLSNGGLVLIGSMFGGAVGFFSVCRRKNIPALRLLDELAPSIFIGIGFGRIGCFLYGCCFGDPTTLPWGVSFPPGSAAFGQLVERGFVSPNARACMPLHPTQLYSAFDGFLLAFVVAAYYPFRRHVGGAFTLGLILYPITRFLIEFLRADELGQLGTGLTISQLLSFLLLAIGLGLAWWLTRYGERVTTSASSGAIPEMH